MCRPKCEGLGQGAWLQCSISRFKYAGACIPGPGIRARPFARVAAADSVRVLALAAIKELNNLSAVTFGDQSL